MNIIAVALVIQTHRPSTTVHTLNWNDELEILSDLVKQQY